MKSLCMLHLEQPQRTGTVNDTVYENNGLLSGEDELKGSLYYPTIGIQGTVYRGDRKAMQNPNKGKRVRRVKRQEG